jgi:hypothetical protein
MRASFCRIISALLSIHHAGHVWLPEGKTLFERITRLRRPKAENDFIVQHYFDSLEFSGGRMRCCDLGGKAAHNHGGSSAAATSRRRAKHRTLKLLQKHRAVFSDKMTPDAYTIGGYTLITLKTDGAAAIC